jgi:CheY-like chemotaxis protein
MTQVSLAENNLFMLHPTAILIDGALDVCAYGPLAQRYAPAMRRGSALVEFFEIAPELNESSASTFATEQTALVLRSKSRSIHLAGTLFATEGGYLLVTKPTIADAANPVNGFQIADFAADDPFVPCLFQIVLLQGLHDEAEKNAQDLKLAREEVGAILVQLRRITGFFSHEFHNLLSIIQLNCDRVISSGTTSHEVSRAIGMIKETATRGGSVSQWLRAISGDADLWQREPLDDFLRANLSLLRTLCGPNVTISSRLMAGSASLKAPVCDLLNCLVSLIGTIAKGCRGNVDADISTMLADATAAEPAMAELRISIAAEHWIDGAELLSCRHHSFLGNEPGRSSIAEFAQAAGGTADYEPAEQTRGIFTLRIPCIARNIGRVEAHQSNKAAGLSPRRHLVIVEDEPAALEALVELLEFEGFPITACSNAEEALAAISADSNAVLVTDLVLPTMDGLTLALEVTRRHPQVSVVVMSGHVPNYEHYNPRWAFMQKPLCVDELIAEIARADT